MPDPQELFAAGRLMARNKAKYMRAILVGFAPVEIPGLGTIGVTEHGVLMIDWDFIKAVGEASPTGTQAAEEVGGLLVHEALHVLLKHGKRSRLARRDAKISNITDDMAINDMVLEMGLKLPGGGPGHTPEHPLHGQYASEYGWPTHLTADEYYERFMKDLPPPQKGKGGKGGSSGEDEEGDGGSGGEGEPDDPNDKSGEGGQGGDDDHQKPGGGEGGSGKNKGKKTPAAPPKRPKAGGGWCGSCAGNPMPNEPDAGHKASRSEAEMGRIAREVAQAVREEASQGRGNVPAGLARWAEELLAPAEVPWEEELASECRHAVAWGETAIDHKYDAPSRKQAGIGYGVGCPIMPRFRAPLPHVAVVLDTSGSMGTRQLTLAGRETNGILEALGCDVTFCVCDAAVQGVTKVGSIRDAIAAMKGGGGTNMAPAIAAVMEQEPTPDVIVCITDLFIGDPGPEPANTRMIWVGVGEQQGPSPTWGKTIRVKDKKEKIQVYGEEQDQ